MTATTHVYNESSKLTKTSSPERAIPDAPGSAGTAAMQCIVVELNEGRRVEDTPAPAGYKTIADLTKQFERDPKRRRAIAKARSWLADYQNEGTTLRGLRLRKGLSQAALGEQVGMTQAHIARIESGRCDTQLTTVVRLAVALEIQPTALFQALVATQSKVTPR